MDMDEEQDDSESTEYEEDEENTEEGEPVITQNGDGTTPMLSHDIADGTSSSSAIFTQPLPLTLFPDGRLGMEARTPAQKRLFVVVQKVEVESHNKRCKTAISNCKRAHTKQQKNREEILALRATIKKLERRVQELEAERDAVPFRPGVGTGTQARTYKDTQPCVHDVMVISIW